LLLALVGLPHARFSSSRSSGSSAIAATRVLSRYEGRETSPPVVNPRLRENLEVVLIGAAEGTGGVGAEVVGDWGSKDEAVRYASYVFRRAFGLGN